MSNAVLLFWDKPTALADWERERDYPKVRRSRHLIWTTSIVIHALAIAAVYYWATEMFLMCSLIIPCLVPLMPLMHESYLKQMYVHTPRHYELRNDGLFEVSKNHKTLIPWKHLKNWQIEPHPDQPQYQTLTFLHGATQTLFKSRFTFDPTQTPEDEIRSILTNKIPA